MNPNLSSNLAQSIGRLMLAAGALDDAVPAAPSANIPPAAEEARSSGTPRRARGPAATVVYGISGLIRDALAANRSPDDALSARDVHARIGRPDVTLHKVNTNIGAVLGLMRVGERGQYRYYRPSEKEV